MTIDFDNEEFNMLVALLNSDSINVPMSASRIVLSIQTKLKLAQEGVKENGSN